MATFHYPRRRSTNRTTKTTPATQSSRLVSNTLRMHCHTCVTLTPPATKRVSKPTTHRFPTPLFSYSPPRRSKTFFFFFLKNTAPPEIYSFPPPALFPF